MLHIGASSRATHKDNMHITRSVVLVSTLLLVLLVPFCAKAEEKPHVTSEQVTRAIQELEKLAQKQIQENALPGLAIAVVFQDKSVYAKGFGVRDTSGKSSVDADTVFQLASLSKPIGSTVVAELVGEGKITWDSKLSVLDPTFAMFDPWVTREITIRDMYAHRSGLPEHAGDLLEDLGFTRAEILHRLRYQQPSSSFRSHYAYTNFGMTEGAIAAAKAYNVEWENASEQKLYRPLGMSSTSSRYSDFMARRNKALGHVLVAGKWVQKFKRDPDAQSPTGGVSSSVTTTDFLRFGMERWLRSGRSIALKSLRRVWPRHGHLCKSGARRATGHRGADECVSPRHSGSTRNDLCGYRTVWQTHSRLVSAV